MEALVIAAERAAEAAQAWAQLTRLQQLVVLVRDHGDVASIGELVNELLVQLDQGHRPALGHWSPAAWPELPIDVAKLAARELLDGRRYGRVTLSQQMDCKDMGDRVWRAQAWPMLCAYRLILNH